MVIARFLTSLSARSPPMPLPQRIDRIDDLVEHAECAEHLSDVVEAHVRVDPIFVLRRVPRVLSSRSATCCAVSTASDRSRAPSRRCGLSDLPSEPLVDGLQRSSRHRG